MSPGAPDQELYERGAELIRAAFERARESGSEGWRTMTPAVLKNRILDATDRTFDESKWGASSFAEFLRQFDDVVVPASDSRPPQVMLMQAQPAAAPQDAGDQALDISGTFRRGGRAGGSLTRAKSGRSTVAPMSMQPRTSISAARRRSAPARPAWYGERTQKMPPAEKRRGIDVPGCCLPIEDYTAIE